MSKATAWVPLAILAGGVLLVQTIGRQNPMPLSRPLTGIPIVLEGYEGRELTVSPEEQRIAGMSSYVSRTYGRDSTAAFWVYVGYYESQTQGKTIHSPKNCLPGAGWEPLESARVQLNLASGPVPVNRYLIANDNQRALVLYWYQGRGRISANEYLVKWELLRDATLKQRTDEALVRVIVPIRGTEEEAEALARRVAERLAYEVAQVVPA
jgi:EpsI family protein